MNSDVPLRRGGRSRAAWLVSFLIVLTVVAGSVPVLAQTPPPLVGGGLTALAPDGFPLDVFLLYPNYRGMIFHDASGTPDLRVRVKLRPVGGDLASVTRVTLRLTDQDAGLLVLDRDVPVAADSVAIIDGPTLAAITTDYRPYLLDVSMVESGTTYTYPAYRVSRAPAARRSEMTISFDEKNRVLVRGVPRFVMGIYDNGTNVTDTQTDPAFWRRYFWDAGGDRRMTGLAVNAYLNYWFGETSVGPINALMDQLQARPVNEIPLRNTEGPLYLQTGNCHGVTPAIGGGINFDMNDPAYVETIGAHPGLGGYYVMDKCDPILRDDVMLQYEGGPSYPGLKHLDKDSMTFGVQGEAGIQTTGGIPMIAGWRDTADVLSTNPYPLAGSESAQPNGIYQHRKVADWTALNREEVQDARPYMSVLQFFKYTTEGRWPTRQEMRNHTWMAVAEGAKGLWWFTLGTVSSSTGSSALASTCGTPSTWCATRTQRMNDLRAVVLEVADLEAVLLADDAPPIAMTNPVDGSPVSAIRTKTKVMPDGVVYVIASNYTGDPVTVRFTRSAPLARDVVVNAEETTCAGTPCTRTIALDAADPYSFVDTFAPYESHVYVLNATAPTAVITAPAEAAAVAGTVRVTAAVSQGTGYTYSFAVDGIVVQEGPGSEFLWATTTVPNGSHLLVLTVKAGDAIIARATRTAAVSNVSYTLTVTRNGSGTGTVTSTPSGINCGTDCSEAYAGGTEVTLTATPAASSVFAGWSGAADCVDGRVGMTGSMTCTATFNTVPDLVVSALSAPTLAAAGAIVSVNDTTKNQGSVSAGASTTRLYLSVDPTLDAGDIPLGDRAVGALSASSSSSGSTSVTVPANTAAGQYHIVAKADVGLMIPESNETNNTRARAINIGPDLVVSSLTAPSSVSRGTTISVSDTTRNQTGGGTAGGSATRFYLSRDTTRSVDDVPLGSRVVPALAGGTSNSGSTSITIPAATVPGSYNLIAVADADGVVTEAVETNNARVRAIEVK